MLGNLFGKSKKADYYSDKCINLASKGKYDEVLKIANEGLKDFPNDSTLLYFKAKELIARRKTKEIETLVKIIKKIPNKEIESWKIPKVIQSDLVMKDEIDSRDLNNDPIISDKEMRSREHIRSADDFIKNIVRRAYYLCMKFNMRTIHQPRGHRTIYPAEQIMFLAELNIKYCPEDKKWVLHWFYREGFYAIERHEYAYAVNILTEYINLTKDDKDEAVHNKYYSMGLALFNLGFYKQAIKDFNRSLKFTKKKELINEVQDILAEAKRRNNFKK